MLFAPVEPFAEMNLEEVNFDLEDVPTIKDDEDDGEAAMNHDADDESDSEYFDCLSEPGNDDEREIDNDEE